MKQIITKEYTRYGGDHDHILYLDISVRGNMQLCIDGDSVKVEHLTSDPKYMEWLSKHCASLLLIPKEKWYLGQHYRHYDEFHCRLDNLHYLED